MKHAKAGNHCRICRVKLSNHPMGRFGHPLTIEKTVAKTWGHCASYNSPSDTCTRSIRDARTRPSTCSLEHPRSSSVDPKKLHRDSNQDTANVNAIAACLTTFTNPVKPAMQDGLVMVEAVRLDATIHAQFSPHFVLLALCLAHMSQSLAVHKMWLSHGNTVNCHFITSALHARQQNIQSHQSIVCSQHRQIHQASSYAITPRAFSSQ